MYMKEIWGRPKDLPWIEIEFHDKGLPISEKFSKFLGSLVRKGMYCLVDVESWPKVPRKLKMDMLDVIKVMSSFCNIYSCQNSIVLCIFFLF